jgi:hypothetical protein
MLQTELVAIFTNISRVNRLAIEINAEFNDFHLNAGARFDRARRFFTGAGFFRAGGFFAGAGFFRTGGFFAGAGFFRARRFFARAGFFGARRFFAGAGFDRAGGFFAGARFFNGAGGFRFVCASSFNPPPGVNSSVVDPEILDFTAFRVEHVALASSHVVKASIEALTVVIASAVYEFNALGSNDNFAGAGSRSNAGARCRFFRARGNLFARAGYRFFRAGGFFSTRSRNIGARRFSNFARARFRFNTGAGFFDRAGRSRSFNAVRFNPPPCLGNKVVNPLRIFSLAIRIHSIALAFFHVVKT